MSADRARIPGPPAPQWAALQEPSPFAALSDDDLMSMRDELEPTPPASQTTMYAARKRKPDVPASEDERAAGTKQVKKTKGLKSMVGGDRVEGTSLPGNKAPLPSTQSQAPPVSPLDNIRPRIQVAKKRAKKSKPTRLTFQLEGNVARPELVSPSQPAPSSSIAVPSSNPSSAMQQAPPRIIPIAKPRSTEATDDKGSASRPAAGTKGKEVNRSDLAPARGLGQLTKSKDTSSSVSSLSTKPFPSTKAPQVVASVWRNPPGPPCPIPLAPRLRLSTVSASTSQTVKPSVERPAPTPVSSASKAAPAPLLQAKAKRQLFLPSDSSSDENVQAPGGSEFPGARSARKSLGLTKVPIPKTGAANAQTGRRESDSSVSAEELPVKRKKKKIKLTHVSRPASIAGLSHLTATQQRRKSAAEPRSKKVEEVIDLLSDSDGPSTSTPALTQAKRPRASAPVVPEDVINITDSDSDRARPPLQSSQSLPNLQLRYDPNGAIIIDDDDEDEPVAHSAADLSKTEKPLPVAAGQGLARHSPVASPTGVMVEEEDALVQEQDLVAAVSDDVPLEEQLQELDIGALADGVIQDSPEPMEDIQIVERLVATSSTDSPPETTPSEDAALAISTDVQLNITSEEMEVAGSSAASPQASGDREKSQSLQHVRPWSSRWVTPRTSAGGHSKGMYGGPRGFFKDVFASSASRKNRSESQAVPSMECKTCDEAPLQPPESKSPRSRHSSGHCLKSTSRSVQPSVVSQDQIPDPDVLQAGFGPRSHLASPRTASTSKPFYVSAPAHLTLPAQSDDTLVIGNSPASSEDKEASVSTDKDSKAPSLGVVAQQIHGTTTSLQGSTNLAQNNPPALPAVQVPAPTESLASTPAAGLSLAEVINSVYQERQRKAQETRAPPELIDLTLDDDEDEVHDREVMIAHCAPITSGPSVTKEEIISPPVSTINRPDNLNTGPLESKVAVPTSTASALNAARSTANVVQPKLEHRRRVQPDLTQLQNRAKEWDDDSEENATPIVHWRRPRGRPRKNRSTEGASAPLASPSPSQGDASEQEIAESILEDEDAPMSGTNEFPTRRRLRPRNRSRNAIQSGRSSVASHARRSTGSGCSSLGPAELSDNFDRSFAEPRIASPSDDPDYEPSSFELVARNAGFEVFTWQKDHRVMMKEFANHHVLAKDLPHELQDRINALGPRARKEGNMQVNLFEQVIIENTFEDEPHAPPIRIINEIDDELTPPFEFHYSNLMWHGEGVPKPDIANLRGCGCLGPCDPKSKTCSCIARQKRYYPELEGFIYHEGKNKGQLKAVDYPIFECNNFCGCSEDCPNRVVQHGRRYPIEIRKTQYKGWGVFAGHKKIPRNTYLGIYAGEYLMEAEAERRGAIYNRFGRTYLFDVDFYHLREGKDDWSSKYSVDAYHAGNFTRYINHSCDPNCCINACYINEANLDKPLLTIFTERDVQPGEELCFSYLGNDDDDDDDLGLYDERTSNDAVYVKCRCGAANCKGRMFK